MSTSETLWSQTISTIEAQPGIMTPPDAAAAAAGLTLVTATTVAGLGAGKDGSTGLIRAGATPFEFLPVTYDATYGHWVSPTFTWSMCGTTPANGFPASVLAQVNAGNGVSYGPMIIWKLFTDAGLSLQLRFTCMAQNQSGGSNNAFLTPRHLAMNAGSAGGSGTAIGSGFQTNSTTTILIGDTAETSWRATTLTPALFCMPQLDLRTETSPGNTNSNVQEWSVYWRYIG